MIADAFARIGRIDAARRPSRSPASPEDGYRMRARLHVRGGQLGFFREGTHDLCDARATRQLLPATRATRSTAVAAGLRSLGMDGVREIEMSENVDAVAARRPPRDTVDDAPATLRGLGMSKA